MITKISGFGVAVAMLLLFSHSANAQYANPSIPPRWEVGLSGGVLVYQGDLAPLAGSYKMVSPEGTVSATRLLSPHWGLRTSLTIGELRGDDLKYGHDSYRKARALKFRTSVAEVAESVVWDVFGNNYDRTRNRIAPYLFIGIGYSFLGVHRDASRFDSVFFPPQSGVTEGLRADLAKEPPHGTVVMPIGAGLRYTISPAWSINGEANGRFAATDYLDGFSRVANNGKNDHYYSITLGVIYTFLGGGKELKCPPKLPQ
ncbi:DUF6089 family protein [Puia sp.]|jgi:hypothetical protein|uniref:DUF6089 family protein n=1 Tax=Puia sp. TaxID=2045100 RepID=UPI002F411CEC